MSSEFVIGKYPLLGFLIPIRARGFRSPEQNVPEDFQDDHHPSRVAMHDWENEGGLLKGVGL